MIQAATLQVTICNQENSNLARYSQIAKSNWWTLPEVFGTETNSNIHGTTEQSNIECSLLGNGLF